MFMQKRILPLFETDAKKGAMTRESIRSELAKSVKNFSEKWTLATEMGEWGFEVPSANQIYDTLFEHDPIEWNRFRA